MRTALRRARGRSEGRERLRRPSCETILREKFSNQEIVLDNQTVYVNCSFTKVHFFYSGGDAQLVNCKLQELTVTFTGDAAKVLAFMHMMGMMGPGTPPVPPAIAQQAEGAGAH